jgi:hypothetical protein
LTDDVLLAHVRGEQTLGIYPLLGGDTCALLACDFDNGTWLLDALAYLDACHSQDVPAVLERSRSGNGGHVWIFFDSPVPAMGARAVGTGLLRQAMTMRALVAKPRVCRRPRSTKWGQPYRCSAIDFWTRQNLPVASWRLSSKAGVASRCLSAISTRTGKFHSPTVGYG